MELKLWHKILLRLSLLPACLVLICLEAVFCFALFVPCLVALCIVWICTGKWKPDITMVWCMIPIALMYFYYEWLKDNDVIE